MAKSNRLRRGPIAAALMLAAALILTTVASAHAAEEPAATPYRPSVSTPAALSEPGWLEMELGLQRVQGGNAARRDSLPYTFKLAFSPDWGVRVGGDLQVRSSDFDGSRLQGGGDTSLVLKRRFAVNDDAAFGLEAGANFPTAKDGLGSGETDYSLNGIYSTDLGKYHADINLLATRLGRIDANQGRWQTTWAGALSRPLTERWGAVAEFSGTRQSGAPNTAQFLLAASYNFSRRIVFDAGASRGLNRASPDWALFTGVTVLLGRIF